MEQSKIDNFKRDDPEKDFPEYLSLELNEVKTHTKNFLDKLNLSDDSSNLDLIKHMQSISNVIEGVSANDEKFELYNILIAQNIKPKENVYINWYRFDDVDSIRLKELSELFDDIWYPNADDIEIYDDTFSWVLSIAHHGALTLLKIEKKGDRSI